MAAQSPAVKEHGFFGGNIIRFGVFAGKVGATGAAAWVVTHAAERLGVPGTTPEMLGRLGEAVVIGLGGTWILNPKGIWPRVGTTTTIAAVALLASAGADTARGQLGPGDRGSIHIGTAASPAESLAAG